MEPRGSIVKESARNAEIYIWSLGQEDSLEEETETHSSILAWRIPGTEDPGRSKSMRSQESDTA